MEKQSNSLFKSALTYGAMIGMGLIIYSVLLYILELSSNKALGYISFLIIAVGLFFSMKAYRDNVQNGIMTYGRGLGIGTLTLLVSAIISSIYVYIFFKFIDPGAVEQLLIAAEENMIAQGRLSDAQIEASMNITRKMMTPVFLTISGFFNNMLFGFIFVLIISAFTKKEGDPYQAAMQEIEEDEA